MRAVKSKLIKWAGPAARMGQNANRVMEGRSETEHLENLCSDESVMIKFVLRKGKRVDWIRLIQERVQ